MSRLFLSERATTPSNPPAGVIALYAKTDGELYFLLDDGTEKKVKPAGAGTGDLQSDGSVALTSNWDVGAFKITALQFESDIVTGTAPLIVASTTQVANLTSEWASKALAVVEPCRNESGGILTKGTPVYISGYSIGQDLVLVTGADADAAGTMPCIGLISADIANNADGYVVLDGDLEGLDTSTYTVGDALYVSGTAGTLTVTQPTGAALVQKVAVVLRSHATLGILQVIPGAEVEGLPNLAENNAWVGNASGVPTPTDAAGLRTLLNVEDGADVTDATNVAAAGALMESDFAAKGNLLVGTGAGTFAAVGVGTDGQVVEADSAQASGVKWATPSSGGAFTADASGQITPTVAPVLDDATGGETAYQLNYTVNKATSGDDIGLFMNKTDTASPGTSWLVDLRLNNVTRLRLDDEGSLELIGDLVLVEKADHTRTPAAGNGYVWVKNTTPPTLMFTDDAGADAILSFAASEIFTSDVETVADQDYVLWFDAPFPGTITMIRTESVSGTCTLTGKINTTALGGTANSVSSTAQEQAHSTSNTFVKGDKVQFTVSANSSCLNMAVAFYITRTG